MAGSFSPRPELPATRPSFWSWEPIWSQWYLRGTKDDTCLALLKSLSLQHISFMIELGLVLCSEGDFAHGLVGCVIRTSVGFPMRGCWDEDYSRFSILSLWACCDEMGQLIFCIKHFKERPCPDLQFCNVFIGKKVNCVLILSYLCCV